MSKYLFIGEDGLLRQDDNEPGEEDLIAALDGSLTIVTFDGKDFTAAEVEEIEPETDDEDSTYNISRWVKVGR